jgi:Fe-S-cluster containining protein
MLKLDTLLIRHKKFVKRNKKDLKDLRRKKDLDAIMHKAHEDVFAKTNCLDCANCCKTTGPLFTIKDIERISKHLRLKPSAFIEKYLRIDEDEDYVLQSVPCVFLDHDNYCSIYTIRPKACREYPHTNRVKQSQIFSLTLKNAKICPAVLSIFEQIMVKMK